jgi:hypothetical protein
MAENLQYPDSTTPVIEPASGKFDLLWLQWFTDLIDLINWSGLPSNNEAGMPGLSLTITTAPLTGGGTPGSMTFRNGILVAQTPAT